MQVLSWGFWILRGGTKIELATGLWYLVLVLCRITLTWHAIATSLRPTHVPGCASRQFPGTLLEATVSSVPVVSWRLLTNDATPIDIETLSVASQLSVERESSTGSCVDCSFTEHFNSVSSCSTDATSHAAVHHAPHSGPPPESLGREPLRIRGAYPVSPVAAILCVLVQTLSCASSEQQRPAPCTRTQDPVAYMSFGDTSRCIASTCRHGLRTRWRTRAGSIFTVCGCSGGALASFEGCRSRSPVRPCQAWPCVPPAQYYRLLQNQVPIWMRILSGAAAVDIACHRTPL